MRRMGRLFFRRAVLLISAGFAYLFLSSCHYTDGVLTTVQPDAPALHRLAVFPFVRIAPDDPQTTVVRCPLCRAFVQAEPSPPESENIITSLLVDRLAASKEFELIPPERAGGMLQGLAAAEALHTGTAELIRKAGAELGAEGVVVGYIYRFRERQGRPYSVKRPASVAYEIHLVRVSDGSHLWRGMFDKTQTSLTENLLQIKWFLREKGRWVTATKLADEGMEEILKTFPGLQ